MSVMDKILDTITYAVSRIIKVAIMTDKRRLIHNSQLLQTPRHPS